MLSGFRCGSNCLQSTLATTSTSGHEARINLEYSIEYVRKLACDGSTYRKVRSRSASSVKKWCQCSNFMAIRACALPFEFTHRRKAAKPGGASRVQERIRRHVRRSGTTVAPNTEDGRATEPELLPIGRQRGNGRVSRNTWRNTRALAWPRAFAALRGVSRVVWKTTDQRQRREHDMLLRPLLELLKRAYRLPFGVRLCLDRRRAPYE
jgi:hypothetical protein